MVRTLVKRVAIVALLALLLASPADISSCGPFFPKAIFIRTEAPDDEADFYRGHLGILEPSYARAYLAMAYRIMSGTPLTDRQVSSVTDLNRYRNSDLDGAVKQWLAARQQVPGTQPVNVNPFKSQAGSFVSYPNCGADAFLTATRTLAGLVRDSGAPSAQVHEWLEAQDKVFINCGAGPAMPDSPTARMSPVRRADREYQIAAAYFYSAAYDQARAKYEAIAKDGSSPWHLLAPYLVARCDIRSGNFLQAAEKLKQIAADPAESSLHSSAASLLNYVNAKMDPSGQFLVLSRRLMQTDEADLGRDLSDYTFLFKKSEEPSSELPPDKFQAALKESQAKVLSLAARDPLTNWIYAFQSSSLGNDDLLERWRSTKASPWLLAALHYEDGKDASAEELIQAARVVPHDSPAFATATFEGVRLLIERKQRPQSASTLDSVLRDKFDGSTENALRAERMKVAGTFSEFLAYAPRTAIAEGTADMAGDSRLAPGDVHRLASLDADAADMLNRSLPQSLWLEAIRSKELPVNLRTELAQAAWLRAILLDTGGIEFARELATLKPAYSDGLNSFAKTSSNPERQFEAVWWILHHPELQPWVRSGVQRGTPDGKIDDLRDNWWCTPKKADQRSYQFNYYEMHAVLSPVLQRLYPPDQKPAAEFLNDNQAKQLTAEQETFDTAGSGPTFLSSEVVRWAKSHPHDTRNREALAMAVRTSRFGCSDTNSGRYVEQAFHLLHDRYPDSAWAKRTPYWYK
jgi:hypothetical protein